MKDKNKQKKQQGKQNKQKIKEAVPLSLSLGKVDLIYKIEFTEKDLEIAEGQKLDIENLNSIKDLQFMKDKKNLWDKIQLTPNNSTFFPILLN